MSLTPEQIDALLAPIDQRRVRQKDGASHLEAWDIRRHLLRVFGWGGWDFEVIDASCILERSYWTGEGKEKETHRGRHTVAYRVIGRLTIKDQQGSVVAQFEDGATGDAQNQPTFADAHDMALKTAMSQALKRCAINLGDRFGLSLYNKGGTGAVVAKTLGNTFTAEHEADEAVTGGDLDEHAQGGAERPASTERVDPPAEGVEADPAAGEAPAPAASTPPQQDEPEGLLEESVATIDVIQSELPVGKRRNLRAWATAQGFKIRTDGLVDADHLTLDQANTVLEYLAAMNQPVPA